MPALARALAIRPYFTRVNKTEAKMAAILKMEERSIKTLLDQGKIDAKLVLRQVRLILAKRGELTLYRPADVDAFLQSKMQEGYEKWKLEHQKGLRRNYLESDAKNRFWCWRPLTEADRIWDGYNTTGHGKFVLHTMRTVSPSYQLPERVQETVKELKSQLPAQTDISTHVSDYVGYGEMVDPFLAIVPQIVKKDFPQYRHQANIPVLIVAHWDEPDFKAVPDRW